MKKILIFLISAYLLVNLNACNVKEMITNNEAGTTAVETETTQSDYGEWTQVGNFSDKYGNKLSIMYMDTPDDPDSLGWHVTFLNGEDPEGDDYFGILQQEEDILHGFMESNSEDAPLLTVTISDQGEYGLMLVFENDDTYLFKSEWSLQGNYIDENGNCLSIVYMDDPTYPELLGWDVVFSNGPDPDRDYYLGKLQPDNFTLQGLLESYGEETITVTISEEDENILQLVVEGGETYHFRPEWSRQGNFINENGASMSITYYDSPESHGWYVILSNGPDFDKNCYFGVLQPERYALIGSLTSEDNSPGELTVTISEEGEYGLQVIVEGDETYHFKPEWLRDGSYKDENGNSLSITYREDYDIPELHGWNVYFSNGPDLDENYYRGVLQPERYSLHGIVSSEAKDMTVTISEEGEDGLEFVIKDGETYHFKPYEEPQPIALLTVKIKGSGILNYYKASEGKADDEYVSSIRYELYEPTTYVITAFPEDDWWYFVKWTMNGEDYSTEEQITVDVAEDTHLVAVFQYTYGIKPAMYVIGEYASGRAKALVECDGNKDARITIEWGSNTNELTKWIMSGELNRKTMTVNYDNCVKSIVIYDEDGKITRETTEYENGTGSIVFDMVDNMFTWKGNQEDEEEMMFEWASMPIEIDIGSSEIYTEEDLNAAANQLKSAIIEEDEKCVLFSISYAGDDHITKEDYDWLNETYPEAGYKHVVEFNVEFREPVEDNSIPWGIDVVTSSKVWLARTDSDDWEMLSWTH